MIDDVLIAYHRTLFEARTVSTRFCIVVLLLFSFHPKSKFHSIDCIPFVLRPNTYYFLFAERCVCSGHTLDRKFKYSGKPHTHFHISAKNKSSKYIFIFFAYFFSFGSVSLLLILSFAHFFVCSPVLGHTVMVFLCSLLSSSFLCTTGA